jgi:Phage integrase family
MYREVTMIEVKEVLRLRGEGLPKKRIAAQLGLDPKTVRRYLRAAATVDTVTRNERCANQAKQPAVLLRAVRDRLQQPVVIAARSHLENATHRLHAVPVSICLDEFIGRADSPWDLVPGLRHRSSVKNRMLASVHQILGTPLAAAKLPDMRLHDLRHSCATLLLAQGVNPRVVMETLGHSQVSLTLNTYSHVLPSLQQDAAARINKVLGGS